ncbi:MAG: hypothetical protein F9K44_12770 [Hyphomicrobiaceae bacterium]|nr:MAG: hypothetical protein F9K44_12770 [Hyphomicrobiaceae bacterium]
MARVVLVNIGVFLLPTLLWSLYELARGRGTLDKYWERLPLISLLVSGVLLVFVSLAVLATISPENSKYEYEPAHTEDGKLIPAQRKKVP